MYDLENRKNKLSDISETTESLTTNTKKRIGEPYSNLGEAYTNLYEGNMGLHGMMQSAKQNQKATAMASLNARAEASGGATYNYSGQQVGYIDRRDSALGLKNKAKTDSDLAKAAKNLSVTEASKAAQKAEDARLDAEKTCKIKNKSKKDKYQIELNKIKTEYDEQLNNLNQQKTKLLNEKSETYSDTARQQLNVHQDAVVKDGINVTTNPTHLLHANIKESAQNDIIERTQNRIKAIDDEYAILKDEELRLLEEKEKAINNLQPAIYEECYTNIEGFKEGATFTITPTSSAEETGNYDIFKTSVHNLIDNKIVEKAVQEKNFKNDLVLSYLSDNEYSKTDLKKIYDSEEQKNNLNKRKNNILKYENNVFKKYIHILKVIVIVLLLTAPILILNKKEIINYTITKYLIVILFVLVFMYIIKVLYDINSRDSINFNKYKLDDAKYRALKSNDKISRKGRISNIFGGTCIGSDCCDEGMTYDANSDKCIYTPEEVSTPSA